MLLLRIRPRGVCLQAAGLEGSVSESLLPKLKKSLLRLECFTKVGEDLSQSGHTPDLKAAKLAAALAAVTSFAASAGTQNSRSPQFDLYLQQLE